MKRLLILLLTGLFAQLVVSCYPEGADDIEDYDVAMTNYDKNVDFATFTDFAIPDSIVYFSNDKATSVNPQIQENIINLVTQNFINRGYSQTKDSKNASFIVTVSAFSNINYAYYVDNWYNNWNWYWNWWGPTPFYPYYSWYPVNVYSYRTGSIVIDMIVNNLRSDEKVNVVWSGIADGLLQGSTQFIQNRLTKEINQCFEQSPYLRK